jgi:hypothetical protein
VSGDSTGFVECCYGQQLVGGNDNVANYKDGFLPIDGHIVVPYYKIYNLLFSSFVISGT